MPRGSGPRPNRREQIEPSVTNSEDAPPATSLTDHALGWTLKSWQMIGKWSNAWQLVSIQNWNQDYVGMRLSSSWLCCQPFTFWDCQICPSGIVARIFNVTSTYIYSLLLFKKSFHWFSFHWSLTSKENILATKLACTAPWHFTLECGSSKSESWHEDLGSHMVRFHALDPSPASLSASFCCKSAKFGNFQEPSLTALQRNAGFGGHCSSGYNMIQ